MGKESENIAVAVRVNGKKLNKGEKANVECDNEYTVSVPGPENTHSSTQASKREKRRSFSFHGVFNAAAETEEVYAKLVQPLLEVILPPPNTPSSVEIVTSPVIINSCTFGRALSRATTQRSSPTGRLGVGKLTLWKALRAPLE